MSIKVKWTRDSYARSRDSRWEYWTLTPGKAIAKVKPRPKPSAFVPVQLAGPAPASFPDKFPKHPTPSSVAAPADIRVELRRGPLAISVSWPSTAAPQCAAWLTEMLR